MNKKVFFLTFLIFLGNSISDYNYSIFNTKIDNFNYSNTENIQLRYIEIKNNKSSSLVKEGKNFKFSFIANIKENKTII